MRIDKELERIRQHRAELNAHLSAADRHHSLAAKEIRLAHCAAYRLAAEFCKLDNTKLGHNALVDHIKASGLTVDEWLQAQFARYIATGHDYLLLISAVSYGMTLDHYLKQGAAHFLGELEEQRRQAREARLRGGPDSAEDASADAAQSTTEPDKNSIDYWRSRCYQRERELREAHRTIARLQRQLAQAADIGAAA